MSTARAENHEQAAVNLDDNTDDGFDLADRLIEYLRSSHLFSTSIQCEMFVPKSIDAAAMVLDGVGNLLSAGQWGTAAIVWAFTEPHQGKRTSITSDGSLTIDGFSKIGIRGLKSINSVRKYRQTWQHAIDQGWAERAEPGKRCVLPEQPFLAHVGGAHVANNSGEHRWFTPSKFAVAARSVMGSIDLDPASCNEANAVINATTFYSEADNGLSRNWFGCVWMNPPFAQPLCRPDEFQSELKIVCLG